MKKSLISMAAGITIGLSAMFSSSAHAIGDMDYVTATPKRYQFSDGMKYYNSAKVNESYADKLTTQHTIYVKGVYSDYHKLLTYNNDVALTYKYNPLSEYSNPTSIEVYGYAEATDNGLIFKDNGYEAWGSNY